WTAPFAPWRGRPSDTFCIVCHADHPVRSENLGESRQALAAFARKRNRQSRPNVLPVVSCCGRPSERGRPRRLVEPHMLIRPSLNAASCERNATSTCSLNPRLQLSASDDTRLPLDWSEQRRRLGFASAH